MGKKRERWKESGTCQKMHSMEVFVPLSATSTSVSPDSSAGGREIDILQPELMSLFCFFCCHYYRAVICSTCYTAEISPFPSGFCCLDSHPQLLYSAPGIKLALRETWGETPHCSASRARPFRPQGCTKMKKGKQQHLQCHNPPRSKARGSKVYAFHLFPHRFLEIRGML